MSKLLRVILFLLAGFGLLAAGAVPAQAKTHHPHKAKHHIHAQTGSAEVRNAQMHLVHLGYYKGKVDGVFGPKTKAGLKQFQRDQGLRQTGMLTPETREALVTEDKAHLMPSVEVSPDYFYKAHPDFYGHVDQQFTDPLLLSRAGIQGGSSTQNLPTRFGKIEVTEDASIAMKRYQVAVNGQPILQVNDQPSVISISSTWQLGNEDAVLFTTYDPGNTNCSYKHHMLILRDKGSQLYGIDNCTPNYKANAENGVLNITFPESDGQRAVGAIWRYENGTLEKL